MALSICILLCVFVCYLDKDKDTLCQMMFDMIAIANSDADWLIVEYNR